MPSNRRGDQDETPLALGHAGVLQRAAHSARRGLSTVAVIALVLGAVLLVAAGFYLGRGGGENTAATLAPVPAPDAPPAPAGADARTQAPEQARAGASPAPRPAPPETAAPPLVRPFEFDPPNVNFGYVAIGDPMEADVKIRNVSEAPLKILTMKPDCRCTTVQDLAGTVIPVGGEIEFTAVIDGRDAAGTKENEIRFVFEGYEPAALKMTSTVTRAVRTDPGYIVALDGVTKGVLTVGAMDREPFRLLAANGGPVQYLDGFDPERDEPRVMYKVGWDVTDFDPTTCLNSAGERMPKWFVLETDNAEAPVVDVRVRNECTRVDMPQPGRQWVLSRLRANIDELQPGESAEFDVDMKWLRGAKPSDTIREVRSETDHISASIVSLNREEDRITARVRVTPVPGHTGLIYGDIRLYAYTPGHSARIMIIGRVADGARQTKR